MAKKIYYGVDGKARKVKKIYYGADGKARKVKKGYIGVGGIARPFWTGGELAYYGNSEDGAVQAIEGDIYLGASWKKYAVFISGTTPNLYRNDLALISASSILSNQQGSAGVTAMDDYLIVAGGSTYSGGWTYGAKNAIAYNKNLVQQNIDDLSNARTELKGGSLKNLSIFSGGVQSSGTSGVNYTNKIDAYDNNLTKKISTQPYYGLPCAMEEFNSYVLFVSCIGFSNGSGSNVSAPPRTSFAYTEALTRINLPDGPLTPDSKLPIGTTGNHAICLSSRPGFESIAYTKGFTSINLGGIVTQYTFDGTSIGDIFLFGGGTNNGYWVNLMYFLDDNLVKQNAHALGYARSNLLAKNIDKEFAIFCNGYGSSGKTVNFTDVYTI